jgi:hypothetical protein
MQAGARGSQLVGKARVLLAAALALAASGARVQAGAAGGARVQEGAAGGIREGVAAASGDWVVLKPVKLSSAGGATFTVLTDGSLLVSGKSPEKDVYTLDFETDLEGITGLRLEALADASLPQGGPGRAANGNFVLNELVVQASAKLAQRFRTVTLQEASCDFVEPSRRASQVHDGDELTPANGWAVFGAVGMDHQLVVETRADVRFEGPTLLRFVLHFQWGAQHELGRLRLSATTRPRPVRVPGFEVAESASKLQERIDAAIDRGVEWLLSKQELDGSWNHEQPTYRNGATALVAYTLLKSGLGARHPAVVRALERMRCFPSRETYTIGCQLMALAALEDPSVLPWMKELAETLLSFQREGFNYPWGNVDLSNTQYGVLGLRAAALRGVKVPAEAFERAAQQALQFAHEEGGGPYGALGFSYNRGTKPTSSMTVAGTGILAIADEQLRGRARSGGYLAAAKRGVEWLARRWSVEQNQGEGHDRWNVYYLYGLERVGSVLGIDRIGEHDWYREGARRLVEIQGAKGEWSSSYKDHEINTCFALLFLHRATAPASGKPSRRVRLYGGDDGAQAVSVRASGDTPLAVWISSFGEEALARLEWPGESGRGLRITKVEYVATGGAFGEAEHLLGKVEKDGSQPAGHERFAVQANFPLPGTYRVGARVTVLAPPAAQPGAPAAEGAVAAAGEAAASPEMLASPPLEVAIEETIDPELLQYARDPALDLLAGQKVAATASSVLNDGWAAGFAVDQLQCRGWAARNDDPVPALALELDKPVRASLCLVTPARIADEYGSRITRISVTVNGRLPPLLAEAPAGGERRKIRVPFPQPTVVRRLEVRVLSKQECENPEKAVGLAEIELQAERPAAERR